MKKEDILLSNSQAFQDIFVYFILDTNNGFFLDIGASDPKHINNTFFLEGLGWDGLSIDVIDFSEQYKNYRKTKFECKDLLIDNINNILEENSVPEIIDYISFDVDSASLNVMNSFDFNKYKFKVMTFEHDLWRGFHETRKKSRELFSSLGYQMVCSDIGNGGDINNLVNPYEDWWVDPSYFSTEKLKLLSCDSRDWHYIKYIIEKSFLE